MKNKRLLSLVILSIIISQATFASNSIESSREELGTALNGTVKDLKQIYSDTETKLITTKEDAKSLKEIADKLAKRSENVEINPSVLDHGNSDMPSCTYSTQNLSWDGSSWLCKDIEVSSECQVAAPDEYRYKDSNGKYICSKSEQGKSLSYYWQFRGYSEVCGNGDANHKKLYSCNYKNKLNNIIEVADSYCSNKSKANVNNKSCVKPLTWKLSSKHAPLYRNCSINKNVNKPSAGTRSVKCHGFSGSDFCSRSGMLAQNPECGDYWDALFMGGEVMSSSNIGKECSKKGSIGAIRQGTLRTGSSFTSNTVFYAANLFYECIE